MGKGTKRFVEFEDNEGNNQILPIFNNTIDDGEHKISSEYVIGPSSTASVMQNAGTILGILESKWGFLFLIVLPALLAFVNQAMVVASGIKEAKEEAREEAKKETKEAEKNEQSK